MQHRFIEHDLAYDGTQLRSHFAFDMTGLEGDSIISFTGPADVRGDHLVDLEDRNAGLFIYSPKMLHFIIEHFQTGIHVIIARQRLLMMIACEELNGFMAQLAVTRQGDDLYLDNRKLSVSIATCSPVSALIHAGFNIDTENTPVVTSGLKDIGIDFRQFAQTLMRRYIAEIEGMKRAGWKVRSVP